MTTTTPTFQDTAYAAVGIPVLVADKAFDVFTDVSHEVTDRLGPVGENVQEVIDRAEKILREASADLDERTKLSVELDKARKEARRQATAWRKSFDPVADDFEARLPDEVAEFLAEQRVAAWKVVGARKPAAKKAPAKKTTAKKTTAKAKTASK